jgi:putative ABC transport system permease protein
MYRFHFKVFIKTLLKSKLLTIINLSGLAVGFAVSLLVWAFVSHELSYDITFNDAERVFRIIRNWQGSEKYNTNVPAPLAHAILSEFPEIIASTRLYCSSNNIILKGNEVFREDLVLAVDSSFFEVFGIKLKYGNTKLCLRDPGAVVISQSAANKLFNNDDPLGQNLSFECSDLGISNKQFNITGVYDDFPSNSHMNPDFLLAFASYNFLDNPSPYNHFLQTYVLLERADQKERVEARLPAFMKVFYGSEYFDYSKSTYLLQPIKDIHLNSNVYFSGYETPKGSRVTVYLFPALAIFIILISFINFVNLHTSQSLRRRKEIWIKKISGASAYKEMNLFVLDSVILSFTAMLMAICLFELFLPAFERLIERSLSQNFIFSPEHLLLILLATLGIGILAGLYPAMVLISSNTLNDQNLWKDFKTIGVFFSSKLIILQFVLCIFFLTGSIFIYKQFRYINLETDRGFNKENILLIKNPWYLKNSQTAFREILLTYSGIMDVSSSENVPGIDQFSIWGHPVDSADNDCHITVISCDYNYVNTLKMKVVRGRFFSPEYSTDNLAIVLNETAINKLGWHEPIGKRYRLDTVYSVIGIVKDIHYESLHNSIEPMGMILLDPGTASFISIRIRPGDTKKVLTFVNDTWEKFVPDRPIELSFMDREFEFWYKTDRKIGIITILLSLLAVIISCLGLLGLMIYVTIRRTKEIGIRKVNGATFWDIIFLFSRDIGKWLIAALIIATPLSWIAIKKWLQGFAYQTEISWWTFVLAGVIVFIVAIGTITWQSFKTAHQSTIDSLRYE